jgi:hypothetical protein
MTCDHLDRLTEQMVPTAQTARTVQTALAEEREVEDHP